VIILLKKKVMTIFSTFLVGLMLIASGTSAIFTSHDENDNPFTSGTVILELSGYDAQTNHYFDVGNMAPGDTETREISVDNTGTLDLRFNLSHEWDVTGGILGDALTVSYYKHDGYDQNNADIWTAIQDPESANIELAAGMSQLIKVEIELPIGTNDTYQGATDILNIMVSGEQTKNNPLETAINWGDYSITYHNGSVGGSNDFDDASMTFPTLSGISSVDFDGSAYALGHQHPQWGEYPTFDIQVFDVDSNQWVVIWTNNGTIVEQYLNDLGVVSFPSTMNINGIRFRGDPTGFVWHSMNYAVMIFQ
jgi:spore coat-associated protein N